MKVKCFGCTWAYPEEAIRNYARNYAEAAGRLTGGTQRLSEIGDVPATPEQPERAWRETRATVVERLRGGTTFGDLAYVDGRAAGWVNDKPEDSDAGHFRGPRSIYDARGFGPIEVREVDTVRRLSVISAQ